MKTCSICNKEKNLKSFYPSSRKPGTHVAACIYCTRKRDNPKAAAWYQNNKERARYAQMKRKIGATKEQYEAQHKEQNGLCAICGKPEKPGKMLAYDHDHKTGKLRGLLCTQHNTALGQFQDNIEILESAIKYLIKHSTQE